MPDELSYWTCPNGHIVLDHYMPQSGTACNVSGCDGTRTRYTVQANDDIATANRVIARLFKASHDMTYPTLGDDPLFWPESIRLERLVIQHCYTLAVRDLIVPDDPEERRRQDSLIARPCPHCGVRVPSEGPHRVQCPTVLQEAGRTQNRRRDHLDDAHQDRRIT